MSTSIYKKFCGSAGLLGCESQALAYVNGEWDDEPTLAMLMSSYVDAHFACNLPTFKGKNPDIFTKKGEIKAAYKKAEEIVKRVERDEYFMKYMNGKNQVIMAAEWLGCEWKIMIDSYLPGVAIVDLKVMKSLREAHWVKDLGYVSFVEFYGYDTQAAIYQKVVEINTGETLPFFIAGASKESEPDLEIIGIDNRTIRNCSIEIENNIERIIKLKSGEIEPDQCGLCDYCKSQKVLSAPVHYSRLINKI